MNENIDLTKILKDCPKGTKFYSLAHGEVEFQQVEFGFTYPIVIKTKNNVIERFTSDGKLYCYDGECILFPSKDQRDWSKFTAPWYKKEIGTIDSIEKQGEQASSQINERAWLYLVSDVLTWKDGIGQYLDDTRVQELAKKLCSKYSQKLYNPSNTGENEQKSTDKIEPKFNVGDCVVDSCGYVWKIEGILNQYYLLEDEEEDKSRLTIDWVDKTFHLWTIQDAKDGDVINLGTVTAIFKKYIGQEKCICYCSFCKDGGFEIPIENGEDNVYGCYNATPTTKEQRDSFMKVMNDAGYEWDIEKKKLKRLILNRFDPKTLQPFDKVLVYDIYDICEGWACAFFSHIRESEYPYSTSSGSFKVCIPYNDDTKHLLGTTEEAPEYYRYLDE